MVCGGSCVAGQINNGLAFGKPAFLEPYMLAYERCARRSRDGAWKPLPYLISHPCGEMLVSHSSIIHNDTTRRFWFQWWIVREGENAELYQNNSDTFYLKWFSQSCWQQLNWLYPKKSTSVLVHMNTTCSCDPRDLADVFPAVYRTGVQATVAELQCNFVGSYCRVPKVGCKACPLPSQMTQECRGHGQLQLLRPQQLAGRNNRSTAHPAAGPTRHGHAATV